jgi:Raf kinase inhibitor-like YbhB/YbcL family protein
MLFLRKIISFVLLILLFISPVSAKTVPELISILNEADVNFNFFFWQEGNNAFLTSTIAGSPSIWAFTNPEKKWQPLYNASAFDGFPGAKETLLNVSFNEATKTLTIGGINPSVVADSSIVSLLDILKNKTFIAKYFFWNVVKDGKSISFLTTKKSNGEMAIWHFTQERKWQPIHNANATPDFPKAPKTIESTTFNLARGSMKMGKKDEISTAKLVEQYPMEIDKFKDENPDLFQKINKMKRKGLYESYRVGDFSRPNSDLNKALRIDDLESERRLAEAEAVSSTEQPSTERPSTERPSTERPSTERPSTERPSTERPSAERPSTEQPQAEPERIPVNIRLFKSIDFYNEEEWREAEMGSPNLEWEFTGTEVKSFAITIRDMDYHNAEHWVVVDIKPSIRRLRRNFRGGDGIRFLPNKYDYSGQYKAPFPPQGEVHRYRVTLYALDVEHIDNIYELDQHRLRTRSLVFRFRSSGSGGDRYGNQRR